MIYGLYRALTTAGGPLISAYLRRRLRRGKEDPARFPERLGRPGRPRPAGKLAWLHCASVGEAVSMLPLVDALLARPGWSVLMTTGSVTSARLMAERLPAGAIHQFVPVDRLPYVRGFLEHWRPDLALWAESEFWPNMLAECRRRSVPMVLVQGRVSPGSLKNWSRVPGFIRRLLSSFSLCLAQTQADAERLRALGAAKVACHGNLKNAAPPQPVDEAELARLKSLLAGRKLWLAASTHPGEEDAAARVHRALAEPGLLTLIIPRHPERGPAVRDALAAMGLRVALRSAGEQPGPDTDIYVADTMGEVGLFYRLAPIVFMGKSLIARGGQNPFEPAKLGAAVLFGPHMDNFPEMAPQMVAKGAARQVADEAELADAVRALLAESTAARAAAQAYATEAAGVLEAVMAALEPFLHARP